MSRALTLLLVGLATAGCGSTEPTSGPYVTAVVAGRSWRAPASEAQLVYSVDSPDAGGSWFTIASRQMGTTSELVSLNLPDPPHLGAYSIDGGAARATFASCPTQDLADCAAWPAIPGDPGQLEITAVDTAALMIEGTFSFRGHLLGDSLGPVKVISNGRFRVHLTSPPVW